MECRLTLTYIGYNLLCIIFFSQASRVVIVAGSYHHSMITVQYITLLANRYTRHPLLLPSLEKLPPYGQLFLCPAEGCSLHPHRWGPSGPTMGPFRPSRKCYKKHLEFFAEIHLKNFTEICLKFFAEIRLDKFGEMRLKYHF